MEKIDCDIIWDLIPSYVDGICSEATKKCVEGHVEGCSECRLKLKLASGKNYALSGKDMEQKGLDGLKRIKGILKIQNIAMYVILAFLFLLAVLVFFVQQNFVTYSAYSVLFAICVAISVFAGIGYKEKEKPGKTEYILGGVSLLMDVWIVLMFFYVGGMLREEAETIFGIKTIQLGPFVGKLFMLFFVIQIAFFAFNLAGIIKHDKDNNWLLCINMTGMFLTFKYEYLLHLLSGFGTLFPMVVRGTVEIVMIGLLGAAASFAGAKVFRKRGRIAG